MISQEVAQECVSVKCPCGGVVNCMICQGEGLIRCRTPIQLPRMAMCACGKMLPSHPGLMGFTSRATGSEDALCCRNCGFSPGEHDLNFPCRLFESRGEYSYDLFHCGCRC